MAKLNKYFFRSWVGPFFVWVHVGENQNALIKSAVAIKCWLTIDCHIFCPYLVSESSWYCWKEELLSTGNLQGSLPNVLARLLLSMKATNQPDAPTGLQSREKHVDCAPHPSPTQWGVFRISNFPLSFVAWQTTATSCFLTGRKIMLLFHGVTIMVLPTWKGLGDCRRCYQTFLGVLVYLLTIQSEGTDDGRRWHTFYMSNIGWCISCVHPVLHHSSVR